jgi:hypothetical protein
VATREDHEPQLEDLFPTVVVRGRQEPPTTGAGEGWREKRAHHAPESETHSLARACHAPVRGRQERPQLVSVEMEDASEY